MRDDEVVFMRESCDFLTLSTDWDLPATDKRGGPHCPLGRSERKPWREQSLTKLTASILRHYIKTVHPWTYSDALHQNSAPNEHILMHYIKNSAPNEHTLMHYIKTVHPIKVFWCVHTILNLAHHSHFWSILRWSIFFLFFLPFLNFQDQHNNKQTDRVQQFQIDFQEKYSTARTCPKTVLWQQLLEQSRPVTTCEVRETPLTQDNTNWKVTQSLAETIWRKIRSAKRSVLHQQQQQTEQSKHKLLETAM